MSIADNYRTSRYKRGRLPAGAGSSSVESQAAVALRLVARGELSALATPSCRGSCCRTHTIFVVKQGSVVRGKASAAPCQLQMHACVACIISPSWSCRSLS